MAKNAKADTTPQSYFVFKNERLLEKTLNGSANLKTLLEEKFKVKITKEVTQTEDLVLAEKATSKKVDDYVTVHHKTVKANIVGAKAEERDKIKEILKRIEQHFIAGEEQKFKEILAKPSKLDDSKRSVKIGDDLLDETIKYLSDLKNHEQLKRRDDRHGVKKDMPVEQKEALIAGNKKYTAEAAEIKEIIDEVLKEDIRRLHPNQAIEALISPLNELSYAIERKPLGQNADDEPNLGSGTADAIIISLSQQISTIKGFEERSLEIKKQEKEALYKQLSDIEKKELGERIQHALKEKKIPLSVVQLESYIKTAVYNLREGFINNDQVRDIIQRVNDEKPVVVKRTPEDKREDEKRFADEQERRQLFKNEILVITKGERNRDIVPRNPSQAAQVRNMRKKGLNIVAGPAGTGKTTLAIAYALSQLDAGETSHVVIVSPMEEIDGRKTMGYLPGGELQKMGPFVRQTVREMIKQVGKTRLKYLMGLSKPAQEKESPGFAPPDMLDELVNNNPVQFQALASVRGMDYPNSIIIVDEAQNMTMADAKAIATRAGDRSQIIFCGDPEQTDIGANIRDRQGHVEYGRLPCLPILMKYADDNPNYVYVTKYDEKDIVRSDLTRSNVNWFKFMEENAGDIVADAKEAYDKRMTSKNGLHSNGNPKNGTPTYQ